jgi:MFS family permease
MDTKKDNLKATSFAALALAFASFGDAFLYPFLPVNADLAGIPVIWVGLLLSINRFVRIFSNTFIVHLFARFGLRMTMICATSFAIASTLGYGIATGPGLWMTFRVIWGLAFSAMRTGTLGYALQNDRQGFALGVSRSLQEAGPMLSLFLAPVFLEYIDSAAIFFVLGVMSLPAIYFAWNLPAGEDKTQPLTGGWILCRPSTFNSITLVSAFVIDGILIVVLGILFLHYRDDISLITAASLAAFYLGYRRVCLVALSPAGGWIGDKIGFDRLFNVSMILVVIGLLMVLSGWIGTGAIIVFTFYSVNAAITPGPASRTNKHALAGVAENATWRDIGAAIGTLTGGLLISSPHLNAVLIMAILALVFLLLIHIGTVRKAFKIVHSWK